MKINVEDLRNQYAVLSDEGLLAIDREDLVDLARQCFDEELAHRKLKSVPVKKSTPHSEPQAVAAVGTFSSREEARRVCDILRVRYIAAHLDPDGLTVLVPISTLEAAREHLEEWVSDEQATEAAASATYVRHGLGTVRPYLYGRLDLLEFVQEVFGAVELERVEFSPRSFHVEFAIGDSAVVLEVGDPPPASAAPASVYVYVPDVDAAYGRALEAGAEELAPPQDKPYDERAAGVKDSFGNTWWIATYQAP